MKSLTIALMFVSGSAWACGTGCEPYNLTPNQVVCACEAPTEKAVQPSDEKPRRSPVPEWLVGTVREVPKETAENHKGDLIPADKE